MKVLNTIPGAGYPLQMDFLLNLQTEMLAMGNSLLGAIPFDMALSGCAVTDNGNGTVNIASGMMYVGGQVVRFDGANNVASDGSKAIAAAAPIATDMMQFGNGSNYNTYSEVKAAVVASTLSNVQEIKIGATLYNITRYIQDTVLSAEVKGTIKHIHDLDGTFAANFDSSGLGITPRWNGWALDNGNNGTPGSAGRTLIAQGTYTDTVTGLQTTFNDGDKVGEQNHKLTVAELPAHTHFTFANSTQFSLPNIPDATTAAAISGDYGGNPDAYLIGRSSGTANIGLTSPTGSSTAHNNMPPSMVVYRVMKVS